jgi:hypothetical protein
MRVAGYRGSGDLRTGPCEWGTAAGTCEVVSGRFPNRGAEDLGWSYDRRHVGMDLGCCPLSLLDRLVSLAWRYRCRRRRDPALGPCVRRETTPNHLFERLSQSSSARQIRDARCPGVGPRGVQELRGGGGASPGSAYDVRSRTWRTVAGYHLAPPCAVGTRPGSGCRRSHAAKAHERGAAEFCARRTAGRWAGVRAGHRSRA